MKIYKYDWSRSNLVSRESKKCSPCHLNCYKNSTPTYDCVPWVHVNHFESYWNHFWWKFINKTGLGQIWFHTNLQNDSPCHLNCYKNSTPTYDCVPWVHVNHFESYWNHFWWKFINMTGLGQIWFHENLQNCSPCHLNCYKNSTPTYDCVPWVHVNHFESYWNHFWWKFINKTGLGQIWFHENPKNAHPAI